MKNQRNHDRHDHLVLLVTLISLLGIVTSMAEPARLASAQPGATIKRPRSILATANAMPLLPTAPANDDFANAQTISGPSGSVTGSNVGATAEPDEPEHASPGGKSVWYRWQAPSSGIARFDTGGSDFNTLLAVYIGPDVSAEDLTFVASNDDRINVWYPSGINGDNTSVVTFNAEADTVYNIAVDGSAGVSGNIRLNWNLCSPAAAPTPIPKAVTLDFSELPPQPVNGLTYKSVVTFGFKVNGTDSIDGHYNSEGPGTQAFVQDPSLEGNAAGTLTLVFADPTSVLRFGVALNSQATLTAGFTVQLFDASANSLGTFPVSTSSCSSAFPSESLFDYSGLALSRAVITFNSAATRFALDNLSFFASNPIDNARTFVRQHYLDFLNREPDPPGLDYWTGTITQCGTEVVCIRNKRTDVSNAFFFELEYQQTGAYVFRLYREAYGNNQPFPNPDTSNQTEARKLPGYSVFAQDRTLVVGGANVAQAQLDLANTFVGRPEFLAKYPASLAGPDFVDAVLATMKTDTGNDLTAQRNALINLFNAGGRGAVIYRLADDNLQTNPINNRAFIDAEYNRAFVATQYFGYLRRDSDIGGFLFWLAQVNSGALRDVAKQHAMVCAFITSVEYQLRFGIVATHSNADCSQ